MTVLPTTREPRLQCVDPCTDPSWAALMAGSQGSLFGAPPWTAAIADTYELQLRAHVLDDEAGPPRAGFAYAAVDDARGHRVLSLPFCERLDPVVADVDEWARLVAPVLSLELPTEVRVFDGTPPCHDARFRARNEVAWHGTDLQCPAEDLSGRLRSTARRNIRTAIANDVSVRLSSTSEAVEQFHRLHLATRKHKYRLLAQPLSFFERLWSNFRARDGIVVALARHRSDVIAGMVCLRWNDTMYYKFGASLGERLSVRPNDLLAWECLRFAHEQGCHAFDWGVSDLDQPGLVSFKRKFATIERTVKVLRTAPSGDVAATDAEMDGLLSSLTELLTADDVPDAVTARAGDLLYRYFC